MNEYQKRVLKAEYKPGCFILLSFPKRDLEETGGETRVKTTMSFLHDAGEYATEWEPEYGPIQVWHKCAEDAACAREHYYYDFTDSGPMNWSQLAVDENGLPAAAARGDFGYIFEVLKRWAKRE